MRKAEARDEQIKVEREGARSLADLIEAAGYIIYYGASNVFEVERLTKDFVELVDYLVERLEHADSERFK